MPVWFYDWSTAQPYDEAIHGSLRTHLKEALVTLGASSA
jgi:hypothetical protein